MAVNKQLAIWVIGTNGSGKTSLARFLHEKLRKVSEDGPWDFKQDTFIKWKNSEDKICGYTQFSRFSANLGKLDGAACGGTDTLNSKAQIIESLEVANEKIPIVIVEGIMATATWIDFLKTERRAVFLIHLDIDEEANLERLRARRAVKADIDPSAVEITPETKEKLASKRTTFRNLYSKMQGKVDESIQLKTENLTPQQVQKKVWKKFFEYIDQSF
jgi:uridine kinase